MAALVAVETVVLVLLAVLVVGLLRSHAAILRRLHELGVGVADPGGDDRSPVRVLAGVPEPVDRPSSVAHDLSGRGLGEDVVALRVVGAPHDTLLAFLSSGCLTCGRFWEAFADRRTLHLPPGTRLVVVTKDPAEESPSRLAELAAPGLDVVMSSRAWNAYSVPGSPYFVYVEGRTGRVRGEGTGTTWEQVAGLLAQATGDLTFTAGPTAARRPKTGGDAEREARIDRELMAAGIFPGDPTLFEVSPPPPEERAR
jgi:hypothetical protein